jgi:succinate dehydrogenase / fumarate reductase cytochrome b subunit
MIFKEAWMGLKRNVGLMTALRYKGQGPFLTYILHRIGGLGMAVFISVHLLASFVSGPGGRLINNIYQNWVFQIVIFFCVLFHAINGLRITILDLFPRLISYHRQAITVEWVVFAAVYGFAVFTIIRTGLGG